VRGNCTYCRREMHHTFDMQSMQRLTYDHWMPRKLGGKDNVHNTVACCYACNQMKGDMHPDEWQIVMRDIPEWWRLADYRGPRGAQLVKAMRECGFDFDPKSNGQPYTEWWSHKAPPAKRMAA